MTWCAPVRDAVFRDAVPADELIARLAALYRRRSCDGLFLSAVSYEGVRLPVAGLLKALEHAGPRLVVIDGAQALGHANPNPARSGVTSTWPAVTSGSRRANHWDWGSVRDAVPGGSSPRSPAK